MKRNSIFFFLIFILLVGIADSPLSGQQQLTLERSIEIALERNPELRSAEQNLRQAGYNVTSARANALPSITAAGSYQRAWELPVFVLAMPPELGGNGELRVRMGVENTLQGGFVLQQPIFMGGSILAGIGIASDAHKISKYLYESAEQQTVETVYNAFYTVLLAKSLIDVSETSVRNAEENLRQVQKRYDEGAASRFELLRAEVQYSTIKPNLTESRHRYEIAIENLKNQLGIDRDTEVDVTGEFAPRFITLLDTDVDDLIDHAYVYRPEYQVQQLQRDISRKNVRIARSEFLPRVVFSSALQWQALSNELDIGLNDFTRFSSSELSIQIPLFNGFGSRARYQEARAERVKSEIREENVRNLIATEIRARYNSLLEAGELLQSQRKVMEQAEEGLRLANLLYEEGAVTLLEVIDAQLAYTYATTSFYQAIFNYNTSSVQLERAVGILSPEL